MGTEHFRRARISHRASPRGITAADLNYDGKVDLIYTSTAITRPRASGQRRRTFQNLLNLMSVEADRA